MYIPCPSHAFQLHARLIPCMVHSYMHAAFLHVCMVHSYMHAACTYTTARIWESYFDVEFQCMHDHLVIIPQVHKLWLGCIIDNSGINNGDLRSILTAKIKYTVLVEIRLWPSQ